jgi:hypothetical protein
MWRRRQRDVDNETSSTDAVAGTDAPQETDPPPDTEAPPVTESASSTSTSTTTTTTEPGLTTPEMQQFFDFMADNGLLLEPFVGQYGPDFRPTGVDPEPFKDAKVAWVALDGKGFWIIWLPEEVPHVLEFSVVQGGQQTDLGIILVEERPVADVPEFLRAGTETDVQPGDILISPTGPLVPDDIHYFGADRVMEDLGYDYSFNTVDVEVRSLAEDLPPPVPVPEGLRTFMTMSDTTGPPTVVNQSRGLPR